MFLFMIILGSKGKREIKVGEKRKKMYVKRVFVICQFWFHFFNKIFDQVLTWNGLLRKEKHKDILRDARTDFLHKFVLTDIQTHKQTFGQVKKPIDSQTKINNVPKILLRSKNLLVNSLMHLHDKNYLKATSQIRVLSFSQFSWVSTLIFFCERLQRLLIIFSIAF